MKVWRALGVLVIVFGLLGSSAALVEAAPSQASSASEPSPERSLPVGKEGSAVDLPGLTSPRTADGIDGASSPELGASSSVPGEPPAGWEPAEGFVAAKSDRVEALTTGDREVFENPDGTTTVRVSTEPVRFKDADGAWRSFDTDLEAGGSGRLVGVSAPETDRVAARLSPSAAVATVGTNAGQVSLRRPDALVASASVEGSVATFDGAFSGGRDLDVELLPHGFKTTVVLDRYAAGAGTYVEELTVPAGVVARAGGPGIELVNADGEVVGSYGSGTAWDSSAHPVEVEVRTMLVGQSGTTVTVRNSVDERWLGSKERVFPVRIDPVFATATSSSGGIDTYVQSNIANTPQASATDLKVGPAYADSSVRRRTFMKFNLSGLVGADRTVVSADLNMANMSSASCTAKPVMVKSLAAAPTTATVWGNQPGYGATSITSSAFAHGHSSSCPAATATIDIKTLVQKWVDGSTNNGLAVVTTESDNLTGKSFASAETTLPPSLTVTYDRQPTNATQATPADAAQVTTTRPTLTINPGSDPDGDPLQYAYAVSTDPDGGGVVLYSGWLSGATSWQVPAGSLNDGVTYYWTVATWDGISWPSSPPPMRSFTVDMRLGDSGTWPTDQVGPGKVNLTNGNLVVSTSSPSFNTVGGPLGLSYTYNSLAQPTAGLTGTYYDLSWSQPADHTPAAEDTASLARRDPTLRFDWGTNGPSATVAADHFYVRWEGFLTVPTTGTYKLSTLCSDGARVTVNGTMWVNNWAGCNGAWSGGMNLTAGSSVPITVEYWDAAGPASLSVLLMGGDYPTGVDIPSSYLSTVAPTLPNGWTVSADIDGSTRYRSATVTDTAVTFTDTEGTAHRYGWDPTKKAWQPPAGERGVVGTNTSGAVTLIDDDGTTYVFDRNGALRQVNNPADDKRPAAQTMTWTGTPPRLTAVTDPVSGRKITLHYGGDTACTTATGFTAAPAGYLCAVDYGDFSAGRTQLRYNSNRQLARIEDPGDEVTDFAYASTTGLLAKVRDPLAADAVAHGIRNDDDTVNTLITYTSGKVTGITGPEPQAGEARPAHSYTYTSATTTDVTATGLTSTTGKLRSVTYDNNGRITADVDQAGRTTRTAWDAEDREIANWDEATGLGSTTIYDARGYATDEWGPAPTSWWANIAAGGPPTAANQAATPHETHQFDAGLTTLAATWWNTPDFAGAPVAHATGIGATDGSITKDWGTGTPAGVTSPTFSGRLTGWINVPAAGAWTLRLNNIVGERTRLTVDNALVSDNQTGAPSFIDGTYNATTPGWKQISIDYSHPTASTAALALWWSPPGGTMVAVPPVNLAPGYGLETSSTDADGRTTTTNYTDPANHIDPALGVATTTVTDPGAGGLNLTSTTSYEDPTVGGYLRETSHTLPTGAPSAVTTTYWGAIATADVPCTGGAIGVNQGGAERLHTAASPDGVTTGVQTETIYDPAGRPAASRIVADGNKWACTTYDNRWRPTVESSPDLPGAPGHVVTTNYKLNNNPLVTSVTDTATGGTARTTTTVVDLLGRQRVYIDAWGNWTVTTYDQVGRVTQRHSPLGIETQTYDPTGNPGPTVVDGVTLATPAYDTAGRLTSATYANGTKLDPITRDALGRETSHTYRTTAGTLITSSTQSFSTGGKVIDETVDGNDANPAGVNYTYDGAGRLTIAHTTTIDALGNVGTRRTGYGFGTAWTGCPAGTPANTGANTNRTVMTRSDNGGPTAQTFYCYDNADRLTKTTEAGVGTPVYDTHGNTTDIWGESRNYDSDNRHLTTTAGATTVTYTRDGTDRIIARTTGAETVRYGATGDDDSADFTQDTAGAITSRSFALPGGVTATLDPSEQTWSHPNVHGDTAATTDATGVKQGSTYTYDSYGNPGGPTVDNQPGNFDNAWLGDHHRPLEHQPGLQPTIEMGARQYDPTLGRFLETDPIEGGSANDYDYTYADPINHNDYDGTRCLTGVSRRTWKWVTEKTWSRAGGRMHVIRTKRVLKRVQTCRSWGEVTKRVVRAGKTALPFYWFAKILLKGFSRWNPWNWYIPNPCYRNPSCGTRYPRA